MSHDFTEAWSISWWAVRLSERNLDFKSLPKKIILLKAQLFLQYIFVKELWRTNDGLIRMDKINNNSIFFILHPFYINNPGYKVGFKWLTYKLKNDDEE